MLVHRPATPPNRITVEWDETDEYESLIAEVYQVVGCTSIRLSNGAQPDTLEFLADLARMIQVED